VGDKVNAAWVILSLGQFSFSLAHVEDAKKELEIAVQELEEIGTAQGAEMARQSLALAEKALNFLAGVGQLKS